MTNSSSPSPKAPAGTALRSARWYERDDMRGFAHRQRTQQMGFRREEFLGRPVIAIVNTWSDLSPCHVHLRDRAEAVKRGVLLGGCDKSTPGLLMGALSMGLPAVFCPAGPMSNGQWRGVKTGAGTHTKKYWDELRAGNLTADDWIDLESRMTRSIGTCNAMGTASTMTSIVDAMGLTLSGASSIPAADSGHVRMASACGERIVAMVREGLTIDRVATAAAFRNGAVAYMALGGSTNAAIHLIAMAGRAGVALTLEDLAAAARETPVLANLFPSGDRLMDDFLFAGGMPALLAKLTDRLEASALTVEGRTLGEALAGAHCWDDDVIRGVDDPALDVDEDTVLVLRNAGPVGAPGMPEWGNLPIPKKLLARGVCDMVRISDARMSGTHYGCCIVHVAPEAAIGGPLAWLRTGDRIRLDVPAGRLEACVEPGEWQRRRADWRPPAPAVQRSYAALYRAHVSQAPQGCDFDFLAGRAPTPEPPIY